MDTSAAITISPTITVIELLAELAVLPVDPSLKVIDTATTGRSRELSASRADVRNEHQRTYFLFARVWSGGDPRWRGDSEMAVSARWVCVC
jgi:hypothetical protein